MASDQLKAVTQRVSEARQTRKVLPAILGSWDGAEGVDRATGTTPGQRGINRLQRYDNIATLFGRKEITAGMSSHGAPA